MDGAEEQKYFAQKIASCETNLFCYDSLQAYKEEGCREELTPCRRSLSLAITPQVIASVNNGRKLGHASACRQPLNSRC